MSATPDTSSASATEAGPGLARSLVRRARKAVNARLHPRRYRRAVRDLFSGPPVEAVLFLCLGNICRSAYAEGRARTLLEARGADAPRLASAGFMEKEGRRSPDGARAAALERGIDLGPHRSRTVRADELRHTDLVLVMERRHARWLSPLLSEPRPRVLLLGDLEPSPGPRRDIVDPYGHGPAVFHRVFGRIDHAVATLMDACASSDDGAPGRALS